MSVQNNLKRPTFTKSVMGYAQGEVDKYIEHVTERYNSVCRENAELKRRVMALGVRLDEAAERIDELERRDKSDTVLDSHSLQRILLELEREKARSAAFMDALADSLESIALDPAAQMPDSIAASKQTPDEEPCRTPELQLSELSEVSDDSWQTVLENFIKETTGEEPDLHDEIVESTAVSTKSAEVFDLPLPAPLPSKETARLASGSSDAVPTASKTPAEIAYALDFYTADELSLADVAEEGEKSEKSQESEENEKAEEFEEFEESDDAEDEEYVILTEDGEPASPDLHEVVETSFEEEAWKRVLADLIAAAPSESETDGETEEEYTSSDEDGESASPDLHEVTETSFEEEAWKRVLADLIAAAPSESETDDELGFDVDAEAEVEVEPEAEVEEEAEAEVESEAEVPVTADSESSNDAESESPVVKSRAESLAELDFYTDDVHLDGESFDPMTLAAKATISRKPTLADFMKSGDKNKKRK